MSNLTLWDIDKALDELFDALDEADTEEGQAACRQAIAEYQNREVAFIDNSRSYYKHCEALAVAARQEAAEIELRARMFEQRCLRIKAMAQVVMEAHGRTKLEGRRGKFILKGNGGLQALEAPDPAVVPDEYCRLEGWVRADMWAELIRFYEMTENGKQPADFQKGIDYRLERVVDQDSVRAALKTCEPCGGTGKDPHTDYQRDCTACGGAGTGGVPGARLAERGQHVEVR